MGDAEYHLSDPIEDWGTDSFQVNENACKFKTIFDQINFQIANTGLVTSVYFNS